MASGGTGPLAEAVRATFLETKGPRARFEDIAHATGVTGVSGTTGSTGATMAGHYEIKSMTNKARIAFKKLQAADTTNAELVHAIHVAEEEMERLLQEEEVMRYKQTVQAVSENDFSKLKKNDHMQELLLKMAKAAKNAAVKLVEKNRKYNERIDGKATAAEVKQAEKDAAEADAVAVNATREVEAFKVRRRVESRNEVRRLGEKCTRDAKSWYEYMTKNKEEHRMKKLERERLLEQRQKKVAERR